MVMANLQICKTYPRMQNSQLPKKSSPQTILQKTAMLKNDTIPKDHLHLSIRSFTAARWLLRAAAACGKRRV